MYNLFLKSELLKSNGVLNAIAHGEEYNIIVYCDNKHAVNKGYKEYNLKWIKGHSKYNNYKYKFQKLADYVSKHGINNWREYYYKYLLK